MASIGNDPNGFRRILFVAGDGSRKTIRLGKATAKQAEAFKVKVEALVSGQLNPGAAPDDEVARWLAGLSDTMHGRLAAVELVKARKSDHTTLKQLLDGFFEHLSVKPITALGYQSTRAALLDYFGADKAVREIKPLQADQWRAKMKADG